MIATGDRMRPPQGLGAYIGCVMVEHHTANVASSFFGFQTTTSASVVANQCEPVDGPHLWASQWSMHTEICAIWLLTLSGANIVIPANYRVLGGRPPRPYVTERLFIIRTQRRDKTYKRPQCWMRRMAKNNDIGTSCKHDKRRQCMPAAARLATKDEHNSIRYARGRICAKPRIQTACEFSNNVDRNCSYTASWCTSSNTCEASDNRSTSPPFKRNNETVWG